LTNKKHLKNKVLLSIVLRIILSFKDCVLNTVTLDKIKNKTTNDKYRCYLESKTHSKISK